MIMKFDVNGIEKEEDETPLVMVLPDLKTSKSLYCEKWVTSTK